MKHLILSRRRFLKGTAAGLVAAGSGARMAEAAGVTIGIVYVGPRDDFGWNQAHAVAIKALKTLPGVKAVEEENVPETDACAKSMESMVNLDGANIVLGTSFGYFDPFMVDLAKKYAKVEFRHAAPLWNASQASQEPRQLFRLSEPGPLRGRRGRRPLDQVEQARLRRRQADRVGAEQHQLLHARRQEDQSERDRAGDLHRRLVAAGARGRGGQRAGRCRLRRHHLPRRRARRW